MFFQEISKLSRQVGKGHCIVARTSLAIGSVGVGREKEHLCSATRRLSSLGGECVEGMEQSVMALRSHLRTVEENCPGGVGISVQ